MAQIVKSASWGGMFWESAEGRQNVYDPRWGLVDKFEWSDRLDDALNSDVGVAVSWGSNESLVVDSTRIVAVDTAVTAAFLDQVKYTATMQRDGSGVSESNVLISDNGMPVLEAQVSKQKMALQQFNMQKDLKSILDGIFAADLAASSDYIYDISAASGTAAILVPSDLLDVRETHYPNLDQGIVVNFICNSKVARSLGDQLTSANQKNFLEENGLPVNVEGFRIIPNNTLCTETAGDYTSYLTFEKPFSVSEQIPVKLVNEFKAGEGMGRSNWYLYWATVQGVRGASWKGATSSSPTRAALATAGNWQLLMQDAENFPMIKVVSRIAAAS